MATSVDAPPRASVEPVPARPKRRLASPWLLLPFMLLSLALYHDYLSGGFMLDDFAITGFLRQHTSPGLAWLHLWAFSVQESTWQSDLWWADPTATTRFFRPLASLLLSACYHAFGPGALPLHLLSILLHGLAAFTAFRFFAALSGRPTTSLLGGLFFLASGRLLTVGWISALPDLPCVIFINLALLAHVRWRGTGRPALRAASLLCLGLALLCKESAAVAPLAIALLEWMLGRSEGAPRATILRRAWPSLAVFCVFAAAYVLFHLGDVNNLLYLSPVSQPGLYLRNAVMAVPVLLAGALTIMRTPPLGWPPQLREKASLAGITAAVLLLLALRPLWRHAWVRWTTAFFVLQLLPQAATEPGARLLYCSLVPLSLLLAMLVATALPRFFRGELDDEAAPAAGSADAARRLPLLTRAFGVYALIGLVLPGYARSYRGTKPITAGMHLPEQRIMASMPIVRAHLQEHPKLTVIVLNTGGPQPTLYVGAAYTAAYGDRVTTRVLSSLDGPATLERTGPQSITISTDQPGWLTGYLSRIMRRDPRLSVGQTFATPLLDAKVLRLTPDGADVLSVAFTFHLPLDRPDLLFLAWDGQAIAPYDLASLALHHPVSLDGSFVPRPASRGKL